ncbi:uracil-DNA glycosylase [Skermania sp. ID1734]|uniref:uracil-DNA glycosylase n=1 Tax=Skermania sp. ID1734 TaxID=2597516 RepID=UPI00117DC67C|nr:uracil-DNA glycosylase [Skermania sp. ID1734]TSE01833.1 uracil-DNA glycosylase [Skermania sp. ID1734]
MPILGQNAIPTVLTARMARIREPHVSPLNDLADEIADTYGLPRGHVPYVDPDVGGIHARALVLLDNPSSQAEAGTGSGLLSLENNDWTAKNCREAYAKYQIDWSDVVHWNVCPFPIAGTKNGGSSAAERAEGARWTRRVVEMLPNLIVVLPLGNAARDGWRRASIQRANLFDFGGQKIPHCGNRGLNQPGGRDRFEGAIREMKRRFG